MDKARIDLINADAIRQLVEDVVEQVVRASLPLQVATPPTRDLMTFAEVRLALRCSAPTLRKLLRAGKIHGSRIGDRWRFRAEDVQSFLTTRGNNG